MASCSSDFPPSQKPSMCNMLAWWQEAAPPRMMGPECYELVPSRLGLLWTRGHEVQADLGGGCAGGASGCVPLRVFDYCSSRKD